jgi:hypothetical protein
MFEKEPFLKEQPIQVIWLERVSEPAPEDEMLGARHGGGRVELQKAKPRNCVEHISWTLCVQELSRDRDLAGSFACEADHRHEPTESRACVTKRRRRTRSDE